MAVVAVEVVLVAWLNELAGVSIGVSSGGVLITPSIDIDCAVTFDSDVADVAGSCWGTVTG